jgi:hypothetical protein
MALHGSGHRRHGHRAQQLATMALRTAARYHGPAHSSSTPPPLGATPWPRTREREKGEEAAARRGLRAARAYSRGHHLGVRVVPPELWEPLGSASSRALPTPGLELAHRPDDAFGAGPRCERQREQGMAAWPHGASGRRRARRRREEDGGQRSSPSPPRSLRGAEPRRARPGPLLLRYVAVGEGEGVGREELSLSGVGPCSSRRPPTPSHADPVGQQSTRGGQRPRWIGRGGPSRQSTLVRGVLDLK